MRALSGLTQTISDYFGMMKPSIALLNVFVGVSAILLATGLSAPIAAVVLLASAGFLSAGGAGVINCYVDRTLDSHMTRTRSRPLPSGRVSADRVLFFGLVLSAAGVGVAAVFLNLLTGLLVSLGVLWYILVYTLWLKRRTKWNIVVGGGAGCFSALAGWSAVTGAIGLVGVLVAVLIFLWTPGHFWGLAIAKTTDYAKVEIPMLPVVEGMYRASLCTALSNLLLFPFTVLLFLLTANWNNWILALGVGTSLVVLNLRFLVVNLELTRTHNPLSAWRVFKLSAVYLFLALGLIVVGSVF